MQRELADKILQYWFAELGPSDWFATSDKVDRDTRAKFLDDWTALKSGDLDGFVTDADTALAAVIMFDQFPRNMFRGDSDMFATDTLAVNIATGAIEAGLDQKMDDQKRHFLYIPYMHSERLEDQDRALALFGDMGNANILKFAKSHRDVIVKFGRFPHRNDLLGRATTRDEQQAIDDGASW